MPIKNLTDDDLRRIGRLKLLALDVDGVLTGGQLFFSAQGDELKASNSLDGLGIKLLQDHGVNVAIITGRTSPLVEKRASDLKIRYLLQGREDKQVALKEVSRSVGLKLNEIAYMGDDLPDLGAVRCAGFGFTVPNAHRFVKQHADYCTEASGGQGAVREVSDLILSVQGKLDDIHHSYL